MITPQTWRNDIVWFVDGLFVSSQASCISFFRWLSLNYRLTALFSNPLFPCEEWRNSVRLLGRSWRLGLGWDLPTYYYFCHSTGLGAQCNNVLSHILISQMAVVSPSGITRLNQARMRHCQQLQSLYFLQVSDWRSRFSNRRLRLIQISDSIWPIWRICPTI
jgi:hypothetical protein